MSLTQKQKDTIREEFRDKYMSNLGYRISDLTPKMELALKETSDWWLKKLDQAYQQGFERGAKDKVEEDLKKSQSIEINCLLDSLKDNT